IRRPMLFSVLLLLLSALGPGWSGTPDTSARRPSCTRCDLRRSCNCSHSSFTRVPAVTTRVLSLDVSFNNITVVTSDDLAGLKLLTALYLQGNGLASIQPSAFDSLWNLVDLDLSDNQLTAVNQRWFSGLGALQRLNLLNNPYSCLGSPVFQDLLRLRRLDFGGPALEEIRKRDLHGVNQLEELSVHGNNLARYESGAFADIWPLGEVTLKLHGPFLANPALAAAVLADVTYPETHVTLEDLHLIQNRSIQPFTKAATRRIRQLTFRNLSLTDEAIVNFLVAMNGVPLTYMSFEDITLTGEGRWEPAGWTEHESIDELSARNVEILDVFKFLSLMDMTFLLKYPRKGSFINCGVFVMPCRTSQLLLSLQYLDLSDNLLTDLTLTESLCDGGRTLQDLRVLNVSGNALKSLSLVSQLVSKHSKLTHLDISRNGYSSMPARCPWPAALRHLNISRAKLTAATSCLPATLQVLDLSYNHLRSFSLLLPALRELDLSGNKLLHLPPGGLLPQLETLTLQSNALIMFHLSELRSFRRLENFQAANNKFVCSCDFVAFLQSGLAGGGAMRLTDDKDAYVCDSPLDLQGQPVARVHLSLASCHQVVVVSVSCGLVLFSGTLLSVALWRLHALWYLKMTWAWIRAKRGSRRRNRLRGVPGSEALVSFDAFVSYSEQDASWVENLLVPELEEPSDANQESLQHAARPLTLCLHKRDFLPGRWVMDNIMSAMECSRRTIFVLSESFVRSEWCRYELDFSHFWLLDCGAGGDDAILVLLEPLSKDDIPKRFCKLRKLMSSTTYLEWPQDDGRRPKFWRSLRDALQADENQ
uniref:Toll-like receptor 2 n=1 Tax=Salarias fasciatus TaxID=181472 RepID=A0A672HJQ6_SALFA